MTTLLVPRDRVERWVDNFVSRHGATGLAVHDGALTGRSADGSDFVARLPFDRAYDGPAEVAAFAAAATPPTRWGLLLVRKGGFAIGLLAGASMTDSKVGQRHVQGRTKAGGQSQQRFARRRDNQARQAFEAAADHAARIFGGRELVVVTGGDRTAADEVLADPRLRRVRVVGPWLAVPDPRRSILDQAARNACAVQVDVTNAVTTLEEG